MELIKYFEILEWNLHTFLFVLYFNRYCIEATLKSLYSWQYSPNEITLSLLPRVYDPNAPSGDQWATAPHSTLHDLWGFYHRTRMPWNSYVDGSQQANLH